MNELELVNAALNAMKDSYSPYSHFKVGAALLCADGSVYTGCNIENSSYSATVCAERTAFFEAVKNGHHDFISIAVVGTPGGSINAFCPPCGVCRQVMTEFCNEDFKIILFDGKKTIIYTLSDLMPLSFGEENLNENNRNN